MSTKKPKQTKPKATKPPKQTTKRPVKSKSPTKKTIGFDVKTVESKTLPSSGVGLYGEVYPTGITLGTVIAELPKSLGGQQVSEEEKIAKQEQDELSKLEAFVSVILPALKNTQRRKTLRACIWTAIIAILATLTIVGIFRPIL